MQTRHIVSLTLASALVTACIPPSPEPTPAPTPSASPVASPAPMPTTAPVQTITRSDENWMDTPITPGDWHYVVEQQETLAIFGPSSTTQGAELILRCELQTRQVGIGRVGATATQAEMLIRTESQTRRVTGEHINRSSPLTIAELSPSDSLLDAMAFSKGRIAVDVAGLEPIYAPAWPEITRIIEDCRR